MNRRPSAGKPGHRAALVGAMSLLVLLSLLPAGWIRWVGWFGGVANFLVAPVQDPIGRALRRFHASRTADRSVDPELRELRERIEAFQAVNLRLADERQQLEARIVELQRGLALNEELPVAMFLANVIGGGSGGPGGPIKVRAGKRQGVEHGSVAVVQGVDVFGRVVDVGDRISAVLPITDRASGAILGVVMPSEDIDPRKAVDNEVTCLLTPRRDGRLSGPIGVTRDVRGAGMPYDIRPGAIVRLKDTKWPRDSQYLVVGVVEDVVPRPNQRPDIVVRPRYDPPRIGQVVLRVSGEMPLDKSEGRQ
ncbi:MAG: hypothetical protein JNM07_02000 [Phycisphaerae bacterium]|nr:hypothetical protein [Phycisphaerae bacterium]